MNLPQTYAAIALLALVHSSPTHDNRGLCDGFKTITNTSIMSQTAASWKTRSQGIDCEIAELTTVSYTVLKQIRYVQYLRLK